MTPLRFRAWLPKEKEMANYISYMKSASEGIFQVTVPFSRMDGEFYSREFRVDRGEAILMQSTGLFDKAEKEIFDGDVLRNAQASVNVVHWYGGCWCLRNSHAEALPLFQYMDCEVIGNIYDNPDLLPKAE